MRSGETSRFCEVLEGVPTTAGQIVPKVTGLMSSGA
jgi:hypothetical protein